MSELLRQAEPAQRLKAEVRVDLKVLLQESRLAVEAELERLADIPIYFADPLVRRAQSLQQTRDARPPTARVNQRTLEALGMQPGDSVIVRQHWGAVGGQAQGGPQEAVVGQGRERNRRGVGSSHPRIVGSPRTRGVWACARRGSGGATQAGLLIQGGSPHKP